MKKNLILIINFFFIVSIFGYQYPCVVSKISNDPAYLIETINSDFYMMRQPVEFGAWELEKSNNRYLALTYLFDESNRNPKLPNDDSYKRAEYCLKNLDHGLPAVFLNNHLLFRGRISPYNTGHWFSYKLGTQEEIKSKLSDKNKINTIFYTEISDVKKTLNDKNQLYLNLKSSVDLNFEEMGQLNILIFLVAEVLPSYNFGEESPHFQCLYQSIPIFGKMDIPFDGSGVKMSDYLTQSIQRNSTFLIQSEPFNLPVVHFDTNWSLVAIIESSDPREVIYTRRFPITNDYKMQTRRKITFRIGEDDIQIEKQTSSKPGSYYFIGTPFIYQSRTYISVDFYDLICDLILYNRGEKTIDIQTSDLQDNDVSIQIQESDQMFRYNGNLKDMKNEPIKKDQIIYLPLRYFCELLGYKVDWNSTKREIKLK